MFYIICNVDYDLNDVCVYNCFKSFDWFVKISYLFLFFWLLFCDCVINFVIELIIYIYSYKCVCLRILLLRLVVVNFIYEDRYFVLLLFNFFFKKKWCWYRLVRGINIVVGIVLGICFVFFLGFYFLRILYSIFGCLLM